MKKILCYGDSNTWGCSPADGSRFDEKTRWPMAAGLRLGSGYRVIEDGLNGRTVLNMSPVEKTANGIEWIKESINEHIPLDIAIICLGTNDVFAGGEVTLQQISSGIGEIISIIRDSHNIRGLKSPDIIIMSPPGFNESVEGAQFYELQINKLKALPGVYRELSEKLNCYFFNASDHVKGSIIDGSHLDRDSHLYLAEKIADFITGRFR